uniref:Uncharacterized protein n=1 Tax=Marseillevirus LCMAC101 TaxID=2506602 RepID=A0A481YT60_9VIRU|nr:MAG: hypothetical protein LCMAC101_07750 [Marseillevirus LCMAC101]
MEKKITTATLLEALEEHTTTDKVQTRKWREIACNGRHENHELILQYSDRYSLKDLYPPPIRAMVDGVWVITQEVENISNIR